MLKKCGYYWLILPLLSSIQTYGIFSPDNFYFYLTATILSTSFTVIGSTTETTSPYWLLDLPTRSLYEEFKETPPFFLTINSILPLTYYIKPCMLTALFGFAGLCGNITIIAHDACKRWRSNLAATAATLGFLVVCYTRLFGGYTTKQ